MATRPTTALSVPSPKPQLLAARAELRCILDHPAFSPERRALAERYLRACCEVALLQQWLSLAVTECAAWEEAAWAQEPLSGLYET